LFRNAYLLSKIKAGSLSAKGPIHLVAVTPRLYEHYRKQGHLLPCPLTKNHLAEKTGMLSDHDKVIESGGPFAQGDETLTIMLDIAHHLCRLDDTDAVNFLVDTAIPYLMSHSGLGKDMVLELCQELDTNLK